MSAANSERVNYAVMSDIGRRRTNNQDSYIVAIAQDESAWQNRGDLFVVADGMGAHAAGELASRLAVEGVSHVYLQRRDAGPVEAIRQAIVDTNTEIHQRGRANVEFHNMGTTCSALVLGPDGAVIGHVGDSRIYRLRGDHLEQLTFDHSLVWEMRAMGQAIGQHNAGFGLPKNVITRSLGPNADVQVDVEGPLAVETGDRFLICSDGLTGKIEDAEMALILRYLAPQAAVEWLTDLANLRGGPDNITVLVTEARRTTGGSHGDSNWSATGSWQLRLLGGAILASVAGLIALILRQHQLGAGLAVGGALLAAASRWLTPSRPPADRPARSGKGPYTSSLVPHAPHQFDSIDDTVADALAQIRDVEDESTLSRLQQLLDQARAARAQSRLTDACQSYAQLTRDLILLVRNYDGQGDLFG